MTDQWKMAKCAWEEKEKIAQSAHPIHTLKTLPKMAGITAETKKGLRWKAFKWMVTRDAEKAVLPRFFRHPFRYGWNYLRSLFRPYSFTRKGDLFFYGIRDKKELIELYKKENSLLVIGFSYCHKPIECPSGRFTDKCCHDSNHNVCQQCFIGKMVHLMPKERVIPLYIPTVHYIGAKMLEIAQANLKKEIIFLITACEMTLTMFADWGNMVGIKGVGVRLDGRICNTMRAFELSEEGIKPGLTVVLENTQQELLELLHSLHSL